MMLLISITLTLSFLMTDFKEVVSCNQDDAYTYFKYHFRIFSKKFKVKGLLEENLLLCVIFSSLNNFEISALSTEVCNLD